MAELPHMPLATDAYLADTQHLDAQEHGAYLLLLITAWRCRGRPQLPNDDKLLARYSKVDRRTWNRIKGTIMGFWALGADGFWTQKKQLAMREMTSKRVEDQRNKAAKRWAGKSLENNKAGDAAAYAGVMPEGMQPKPKPSYTPKSPKGTKGYGDQNDPLFADFKANVWDKRWKREGHEPLPAFRAYAKLTDPQRTACKTAIERCARELATGREEKFRPLLASWLNSHGWEADAVTSPEASAGPDWAKWVAAFNRDGSWNPQALGPEPSKPGCRAPRELLIGIVAA